MDFEGGGALEQERICPYVGRMVPVGLFRVAALRRLEIDFESFGRQKAIFSAHLPAFSLRCSLYQRAGGIWQVAHVSYWNLLEGCVDR